MVRLAGPGIVTVYELLGWNFNGRRTFCIVQEYVEGQDLVQWRKSYAQNAEPDTIAQLIAEIAYILAPAHRLGFYHRDLTPRNILIDAAGRPHLLDFGLALHESDRSLRPGAVEGTRPYMSPEQTLGETHRIDSRTDIWARGVILYELLSGQRPFAGDSVDAIEQAIRHDEPIALRTLNPLIPSELERICNQCLAKTIEARYGSVEDLAGDLATWQDVESLDPLAGAGVSDNLDWETASRIVPKGLRSFDEQDASFFLELLPGIRRRNQLPASINYWKSRIESARKPAEPVGLVMGPSGCGKSSLMKAGILPRLDKRILRIYLEATTDDTERRLLSLLQQRFPQLPREMGLHELLVSLREGACLAPGEKLLIVIDQFEQWLYTKQGSYEGELRDALRQCDGVRLHAILLVSSDYWNAASEFFTSLDISLSQRRNLQTISLFDRAHARKVLMLFGQAYGRLPANPMLLTPEQNAFLDQAVEEMAQRGKVVSIRLAIFADLLQARPWNRSMLAAMGGAEGVGVRFLEDAFVARDAPPEQIRQRQAAQKVLKVLLPPLGMDIQGHCRTDEELAAAANYGDRPEAYAKLIRVLDDELRLITPAADDLGRKIGYQLTHDYLVPSVRTWLAYTQQETRRGQAELLLEERADAWNARQAKETRQLPSLGEYLFILTHTSRRDRTERQQRMLRVAALFHGLRILTVCFGLVALAWLGMTISKHWSIAGLVDKLVSADPQQVPAIIQQLDASPDLAAAYLQPYLDRVPQKDSEQVAQLHARMAAVKRDSKHVEPLVEYLLTGSRENYIIPIRELLRPHATSLTERLRTTLQDESQPAQQRLRAALVLAEFLPAPSIDTLTEQELQFVIAQLTLASDELQPLLRQALRPLHQQLVPALSKLIGNEQVTPSQQRAVAEALADLAASDTVLLAELLTLTTQEQYQVLFPIIAENPSPEVVAVLRRVASELPVKGMDTLERVPLGMRRAHAAVTLMRLGKEEDALRAFEPPDDPEALTQFIYRCRPRGLGIEPLLKSLKINRFDGS